MNNGSPTTRRNGGERPIRVLLVDDHKLFAEAVVGLLEDEQGIEIVGVAVDGDEAVRLADRYQPDIVLMDICMPLCDGIEATRRIRSRCPNVKVIMTTASEDERTFLESIRGGAFGYVSKTADFEALVDSIRRVARGEPAIPHWRVGLLLSELGSSTSRSQDRDEAVCPLSAREKEVLALLVGGHTYSGIAERLYITEHTVRSHVQNMQEKLPVTNRSQLIAYAVANHLVGEASSARGPVGVVG